MNTILQLSTTPHWRYPLKLHTFKIMKYYLPCWLPVCAILIVKIVWWWGVLLWIKHIGLDWIIDDHGSCSSYFEKYLQTGNIYDMHNCRHRFLEHDIDSITCNDFMLLLQKSAINILKK